MDDVEVIGQIEIPIGEEEEKFERILMSDDSDGDIDESLEIILRNTKSQTTTKFQQSDQAVEETSTDMLENSDSFVRAFLTQERLHETLNMFQAEWYRLEATESLDKSKITKVPLMYLDYFYTDQKLRKLETEVKRMQNNASRIQDTWAKLRVQRDNYKRTHMRVGHEKHAALESIRSIVNQVNKKMPALDDMNAKIETADKDRMLLELEVQRLRQLHERLLAAQPKQEPASQRTPKKKEKEEKPQIPKITSILPHSYTNPYEDAGKSSLEQLTHRVVFKAHSTPVSAVAVHPKRKVYATAGDDGVWHLRNAENNELLISGRGHTQWISSCTFHPKGAHLATTSADGTARVWDFLSSKCSLVLSGHFGIVWGCDFNTTGRVLATCGSDATVRLWDMQGGQQLLILNEDSKADKVKLKKDFNCVKWIPFSNLIAAACADNVVGLWDPREKAMVSCAFRHQGSVFGISPSLNGQYISAVDAKGGVRLWDLRKMKSVYEYKYTSPIYACATDIAGSYIFGACDDGKAQVFINDLEKSTWNLAKFDRSCECIAANADADLVVAGCYDGNVTVCTVN